MHNWQRYISKLQWLITFSCSCPKRTSLCGCILLFSPIQLVRIDVDLGSDALMDFFAYTTSYIMYLFSCNSPNSIVAIGVHIMTTTSTPTRTHMPTVQEATPQQKAFRYFIDPSSASMYSILITFTIRGQKYTVVARMQYRATIPTNDWTWSNKCAAE